MNEAQKTMEQLSARFRGPVICEVATVVSVDEDNLSCTVKLMDDTEIVDVRLKAAIDEVTEGLVQIPEVDSSVLVVRIGNDVSTRFVVAFSNVVKVMFYGGSNGPLVIWEDKLKAELDKVKQILTALLNVIGGAPIPEPGSGAPSALQAALDAAFTGSQLPSFEDLTDDKVLH